MVPSYHRRPVVSTDDIAAIVLGKLGSEANLLGYYMHHGGSNPQGKLSTLQESQATGYPNDLPVICYDFQAPLGEFSLTSPGTKNPGQVRIARGCRGEPHDSLQRWPN